MEPKPKPDPTAEPQSLALPGGLRACCQHGTVQKLVNSKPDPDLSPSPLALALTLTLTLLLILAVTLNAMLALALALTSTPTPTPTLTLAGDAEAYPRCELHWRRGRLRNRRGATPYSYLLTLPTDY